MLNILRYFLIPFTHVNSKRSTYGDNLYPLDGIRGIAVLIVISSHTSSFGMYGQGSLGVLLFFILSGFVLTLPFANNPSRLMSPSELYRFAINRILRIMPLFIIAVIVVSRQISADQEWILAHISCYKGYNHFWSVVQEARFYVLFPIIMGLLALLPNRFMRLLILGLITWIAWRYETFHLIDMMGGKYIGFYFWFFLGGIMACLFYRSPLAEKMASNPCVKLFFGGAAGLILIFLFMSSDQMMSQFWRPLLPYLPKNLSLNGWHLPEMWFVLFIFLLLGATLFKDSLASRFLQSWPLRHLGLLSYSLYLFHMPVLNNLTQYGFKHEGLFLAVFIVTYIIALLSYVMIEKPFLMLKPALSKSVGYSENLEDAFRKPRTVGQ